MDTAQAPQRTKTFIMETKAKFRQTMREYESVMDDLVSIKTENKLLFNTMLDQKLSPFSLECYSKARDNDDLQRLLAVEMLTRVYWTGDLMPDYIIFLRFKHPLISFLFGHSLHAVSFLERSGILIAGAALAIFACWFKPRICDTTVTPLCSNTCLTANDTICTDHSVHFHHDDDEDCFWGNDCNDCGPRFLPENCTTDLGYYFLVTVVWATVVAFFMFVVRQLATCVCVAKMKKAKLKLICETLGDLAMAGLIAVSIVLALYTFDFRPPDASEVCRVFFTGLLVGLFVQFLPFYLSWRHGDSRNANYPHNLSQVAPAPGP